MNVTAYGMDIAKRVFQLYWVEHESGEIPNRKLGRQELLEVFAQREAGLIAPEARGSAHWWRRKLMALGHEVKLINAKFIRPLVRGNKTDAADAKAIWTAARQPGMRPYKFFNRIGCKQTLKQLSILPQKQVHKQSNTTQVL
jgi:transposase